MKDYLKKMQNQMFLDTTDIDNIIKDYTHYLTVDLDNLSNIESLVYNQQFLINVDQYLFLTQKQPNQKIEYLISIYDNKIQRVFAQFSIKERENIVKHYGLYELYCTIQDLEDLYTIEEISSMENIDLDELSNSLRLLSNLKLISFDGYNVSKIEKHKRKIKQ